MNENVKNGKRIKYNRKTNLLTLEATHTISIFLNSNNNRNFLFIINSNFIIQYFISKSITKSQYLITKIIFLFYSIFFNLLSYFTLIPFFKFFFSEQIFINFQLFLFILLIIILSIYEIYSFLKL